MTTASASYLPIWTNGTPGTIVVTDPQYGAYGDGVHDDGDAVRRAVMAASSMPGMGTVVFPPGTYLITSYVTKSTGDYQVSAGIAVDNYLDGGSPVRLLFLTGAILSFSAPANGTVPTYAVYLNANNVGLVSTPQTMQIEGGIIEVTDVGVGGVIIRDTASPLIEHVTIYGSQYTSGSASTADGLRFENSGESGIGLFTEGIRAYDVMVRGFKNHWHFAINGGKPSFDEIYLTACLVHLDQDGALGFLQDATTSMNRGVFTGCGGWVNDNITNTVMFQMDGTAQPFMLAPWIEVGTGGAGTLLDGSGSPPVNAVGISIVGNGTGTVVGHGSFPLQSYQNLEDDGFGNRQTNPGPEGLNGSVAGNGHWIMHERGIYKKAVVALVGWNDVGQTVDYPVTFLYTPVIVATPSGFSATSSTTTLTLPTTSGSVVNGVVVVEGI